MSAMMNKYLASHDEERRLAHRQELKRAIAENQVKADRIAELRGIVAKLNADSDIAANEHSAAAGVLQAELDALDQEHVDAILASKQSPAKALERRGEILNELAKLNTELELRCEANKRSIQPIEKQIHDLSIELAQGATLKSKLVDLASPEVRRKRLLNSHRLRVADMSLQECNRMVGILLDNMAPHKENAKRGFNVSSDKAITQAKLSDWQFVLSAVQAEIAELRDTDREIEAESLFE
jgi:hypothetical protein